MSNRQYLLKEQKKDERDFVVFYNAILEKPLPRVDLRGICSEVFDQESLGSCSSNVGVAAQMMLEAKVKKNQIEEIPLLSRLFLYYQERLLEGNVLIDSGAEMRSICKALHKFGVCEETYMPYDIEKFADTPSVEAVDNAKMHMISSYKALRSLNAIRQYISDNNLPVMIGIRVYESFESESVLRTGIVPIPNEKKETLLGGHAVLVVGYDDNFISRVALERSEDVSFFKKLIRKIFGRPIVKTSKYKGALIVRNSWGPDWGDNGYFYLPYEFINKGYSFDYWTINIE